ncbi:MAG: hypothetical protein DDT32_01531 [Syntrophomonadaceae bacterium]|nr:hypothetical protein [Bacillota bacterium]
MKTKTPILWISNDLQALWVPLLRLPNTYIWFRASLNLKKKLTDIEFKLISTVPYQLFCNGILCGWGPWRGTKKLLWMTSHNLSSCLHLGKNELCLLMHDPAVPSAQRDSIAPWWMGEVVAKYSGSKNLLLASKEDSWLWTKAKEWEANTLQSWYLRNFSECYLMVAKKSNFPSPKPRADWRKPYSYAQSILKDRKVEVTSEAPPLGKLIQPRKYQIISLNRIPLYQKKECNNYYQELWKRWQSCNGAWYEAWISSQRVVQDIRYLPPNGKKIKFSGNTWHLYREPLDLSKQKFKKPHIAVLYDFEKHVSGIWHLSLNTKAPATIHILHSETLLPHGELNHGIEDSDCIKVVPGKTQWRGFQQRGTRYALLVMENASGIEAINFGIISTAYNKQLSVNINSREPFLHSALKASKETVSLCLSDGLMDCPWRERAQWVGDSLLSAEVLADLFDDPEPWRRLLLSLVSTSTPGEILPAAIPSSFVDRIPLYDFVAVLSAIRYGGHYENKIPSWLIPFLTERIRTYYDYMTPGGLLENVPGRNFQEWTIEHPLTPISTNLFKKWIQSSRPSAKGCYDFLDPRTRGINAVTNAYWLRALKASKDILYKTNKSALANELETLWKKGGRSFVELLWDETQGLVHERIPALGAKFSPSELPNYAALSAGLLSQGQAERVISNCWNKQKKMVRVSSPYGAKLVVEGLLQYNKLGLAYRYLKSVYSPMLERGTTLWETFTGGSKVHGWGAYPIWRYWKTCGDKSYEA